MVVMVNQAGMDPRILSAAEGHATRIFRHAGIDLLWEQCDLARRDEACEIDETMRSKYPLFLELVGTEGAHISKVALGYANVTKEGGDMAVLYSGRLANLTGLLPPPASKEQILGSMMAHELGHLLTILQHSSTGIMRARWDNHDFWQMAQARMYFTASEESTLRAAVRRRRGGVGPTSPAS
jgi:hypothetical protein